VVVYKQSKVFEILSVAGVYSFEPVSSEVIRKNFPDMIFLGRRNVLLNTNPCTFEIKKVIFSCTWPLAPQF
jgi:hypothetical protein